MSIRQTISNFFRSATLGSAPFLVRGKGVSDTLQIAGMDRPAENVLMVYACLKARITAIQQARLRITDRNDNLVMGGPLFDLFAKPNHTQDWTEFLGVVEGCLALYDEAFIALVSDGSTPDEMFCLSPIGMRPVEGVQKSTGVQIAIGWEYVDPWTGSGAKFRVDEVIVITGWNPHAPLRGLASGKAARKAMQMDLAAREMNLAIFANGGMPDVALTSDKKLGKEQAEELLKFWQDRYSGFANAHRPAILGNGLKAEKLGFAPQELQFLEGLRMSNQDLMTAMRTMPAMVMVMFGENGLSQGSSIPEQKLAWWEDVGIPELARIEAALQQGLVDAFSWGARMQEAAKAFRGGYDLAAYRAASARATARQFRAPTNSAGLRVWFDDGQVPALVRHRVGKVEQFKTLVAMLGYRPDDMSDYLDMGLPPHPTNRGMIPLGVQAVDDLGVDTIAMPAPRSAPAAGSGSLDLIARAIAADQNTRASKQASLRKTFDSLVRKHTKTGARKVSRFFLEQRDRVTSRLTSTMRSATITRSVDDTLAAIFPVDGENAELTKRLLGSWTEALTDGWDLANAQMGRVEDHPFQLDDPQIKSAIEARKLQGAAMNDTTRNDLRKVIEESVDAGESSVQLGDRIQEYYAGQIGETSARPQTAARTQMAGIVNDGQMAAARDAGGIRKAWLHGSPNEAREAHVAAEQTYAAGIPLDEPFVINGQEMDAPGDAGAPVEETANCTCMVTFVQG
jgi:HK97 family phage portal protein